MQPANNESGDPSGVMDDIDNQSPVNIDWTTVISKRKHSDTDLSTSNIAKRYHPSDPRINRPPTHSFTDNNRFKPLQNLSNSDQTNSVNTSNSNNVINSSRPPPIFLKSNDICYPKMCDLLKTLIGNEFKCVSTTKGITIYVSTSDKYRTLVKFLSSKNVEYHTYQLKEDKPFRVVIRGLHPSIDHSILVSELNNLGHTVRSVSNVLSRNKESLPLFFVDLEKADNNDDLYKLETLYYTKIKVEPPRPKRHPAQCFRCQQYGHTRNYCNHPPRCVRCAGHHETKDCQQSRDAQATCALCNSSHPANYKGCSVFKDLRAQNAIKTVPKNTGRNFSTNLTDTNSFPVLSRKVNVHNSHETNFKPESQTQSYATVLQNQTYHKFSNSNYISNNSETRNYENYNNSVDISSQLTNFLYEMKSLFTPLISLINQLLQATLPRHVK